MSTDKPFSAAAERNREAILEALQKTFSPTEHVFEIGSGSGQHACFISRSMPDIQWQPSDLADKLPGMRQWISNDGGSNILPPVVFDLADCEEHEHTATACYTANTLHIVSWLQVQNLFKSSALILRHGGPLCIYGPFMIDRKHTSEGNLNFDRQLKAADRNSGIRDVADLDKLASKTGYSEVQVVDMPANNKLLIWHR